MHNQLLLWYSHLDKPEHQQKSASGPPAPAANCSIITFLLFFLRFEHYREKILVSLVTILL